MAQVVSLEVRKRTKNYGREQIIKKLVDGEVVECVNIDALPPERQSWYLLDEPKVK